MPLEFAAKLKRIPVYPAADGYAEPGPLVKLASNETPFEPLPQVVEAAERALRGANRYPDPTNAALRAAISDRTGVPASRIAIGNGSCDVLLAAGEALLEPGAEVVYAWPSFSIYPHLAAASGARAIEVPLDAEHRHDLDAMAAEITAATRLVLVCNPNNPTSTALPLDEIAAFLERVPRHVAVILDEAYCEFNLLQDPDESIALLDRHPNLVLLRTFSKVYGLCGLRVGYGLCGSSGSGSRSTRSASRSSATSPPRPPPSRRCATRTRSPAASSATSPSASTSRTRLRALGLEPAESQANFVLVRSSASRERGRRHAPASPSAA